MVLNGYDFIQIVEQKGFPPKIIMLRIANRSSDIVAALLEKHQVAIFEFTQDSGFCWEYDGLCGKSLVFRGQPLLIRIKIAKRNERDQE